MNISSDENGHRAASPQTVPPALQGLVQYGDVIGQVLSVFIAKQQSFIKENEKLRQTVNDLEVKAKESVIKIQQCMRAQDSAMEQVSSL